ncbi:MAG: hypothetical protein ACO1PN_07155 [Betaproteobacteria bacterium]
MKTLADMLEGLLKKIFPTRVAFGDGSYVEFLNREAILYAEKDGHQMEVVWYFHPDRMKGRVLRTGDINRWDSPYEVEHLSKEKKYEIQQKIIEYCLRRSIPLEIKDDPGGA